MPSDWHSFQNDVLEENKPPGRSLQRKTSMRNKTLKLKLIEFEEMKTENEINKFAVRARRNSMKKSTMQNHSVNKTYNVETKLNENENGKERNI